MHAPSSSILPVFFWACGLMGGCIPQHTPRTLSPQQLSILSDSVLSQFELAEGFSLELFAAEPLVRDPVAMEIDEKGRIFVVEMPGYPLDVSGSGKVVQLIDSNGDGKPDQSQVFADKLTLPTGIMRWKAGFLVTDAPDVIYLEDSNGDGRADIRKKILTGFARSNPQHNVNSPVYGLDNTIYLANEYYISTQQHADILGDTGAPIQYYDTPEGPQLPANGDDRSVRFNPDTYFLANTSSRSQYGHTFDPWGRYFQTSNASHLHHEVIGASYLSRKPQLLVADAQQYVPTYGHPIEVYPITAQPHYQLLTDIGTITSACAIHWYKGDAFPEVYQNVIFTAEPTHNLIHADLLTAEGSSFSSRSLFPEGEFLRSKDAEFRPVFIYQGPDEGLFVLDYHRRIIEHPEWMAESVNESGELYDGTDRGRIYRILPPSAPASTPTIELSGLSNSQLVAHLFTPNSWYRQNAQRLIVDRKDPEFAGLIQKALQAQSRGPGYVHALWALHGLNALSLDHLRQAWQSTEPGIRENAIRLLEFFPDSLSSILPELHLLTQDTSDRVRFQLVCTLGGVPQAQGLVLETLFDNLQDPWITLAAFTSSSLEEKDLFASAQKKIGKAPSSAHSHFFNTLGSVWAAQEKMEDLRAALSLTFAMSDIYWKAPFFEGIYKGLAYKETRARGLEEFQQSFLHAALAPSPTLRKAARKMASLFPPAHTEQLEPILRQAEAIIGNPTQNPDWRADAVELLALILPDRYDETFFAYLKSTVPAPMQQAAVKGLGKLDQHRGCQVLLTQWSSLTPAIRDLSIDQFMRDPERINMLLAAIGDGKVQASTLGWPRMVRLMNHDNSEVKAYARSILASTEEMDQAEWSSYVEELGRGNPELGYLVYQEHCQSCHPYKGKGPIVYGPDLATLRNREAGSLLRDILDPNRSIADGYEIWSCTLKNGEQIAGIVDKETTTSLTLNMANGTEETLPRSEIETLKALPYSGMPTGLQGEITPKEMSDLISFIKRGASYASIPIP